MMNNYHDVMSANRQPVIVHGDKEAALEVNPVISPVGFRQNIIVALMYVVHVFVLT